MTYLPHPGRYQQMEYRRSGRSGLKLPAISLGLWHNFGDNTRVDNSRELLRHAFDRGITHFDLANNYGPPPGSAEENFGRILREDFRAFRDELVISTKAGYTMWDGPYGDWGSRKYLISSLDQSLKRMGLEYVDIFYHHRPDPETPLEETMRALDQVVRQGKALYAAISNYPAERAAEAIAILRDLGTPSGSKFLREDQLTDEKMEKVRKLNEIAQQRGQKLAQMALAWTLRDARVTSVLIGASKTAQIDDAVEMLANRHFTIAELSAIEGVLI
ncbi:MAG: aldo/keto reductase [Pantoea sp.]|nr:aldo/keto reductase [Pantoea sp.]